MGGGAKVAPEVPIPHDVELATESKTSEAAEEGKRPEVASESKPLDVSAEAKTPELISHVKPGMAKVVPEISVIFTPGGESSNRVVLQPLGAEAQLPPMIPPLAVGVAIGAAAARAEAAEGM